MSRSSNDPPPVVVITGVSGSGKTTVGRALARRLGWAFQEGDDLHPEANRERMARGIALDDADRAPWLRAVAGWIDRQQRSGQPALLACSALKRRYRDVLRDGRRNVYFVHLAVGHETLEQRLQQRGGHFMPPSLLSSQLADWEAFDSNERAIEIDAEGTVDATVNSVLAALDTLNLT